MELFDVTQRSLEVALHGTELRQEVLANNVANVNTPGFKRSDVSFQSELASALRFDPRGHDLSVDPQVTVESDTTVRVDGNNVDPDKEAARLAETQLLFQALMSVTAKRLSSMSQLITGAR